MDMKNLNFRRRLSFALAGLGHAFRTEKSFRTHVACLGLVLLALIIFRPSPLWWALVGFVSALVLFAELMNSALEKLVDFLHPGESPEVKAVKDMAAGAVLVAAFAALWVGGWLAISIITG